MVSEGQIGLDHALPHALSPLALFAIYLEGVCFRSESNVLSHWPTGALILEFACHLLIHADLDLGGMVWSIVGRIEALLHTLRHILIYVRRLDMISQIKLSVSV